LIQQIPERTVEVARRANDIVAEVEKVIVGKTEVIRRAVLTLLCEGHLLLEDIPGVGKTTLAKALARSVGGEFRRVQFTPDLLPSDITGGAIFNQQTSEFVFRPGPVFGNVILVDEINRATPKTQSALLEAMEEHQVTTDGETKMLPQPFFVIATQNSIEMTGTYPLPEAQLDRFFARLSLGYPSRQSEIDILTQQQTASPLDAVQTVVTLDEITELQKAVREVFVHDTIRAYIVDIISATRESAQLLIGSSPRGSLHVMRASQARAAMDGSNFVRPSDVKAVVPMVLGHRVMPRAEIRAQGASVEAVVDHILQSVAAPVPAS
jgi:MoxR-like ATPase